MLLMTELSEAVEMLTESVGGKKTFFIEGIYAQADLPNRNGRTYPKQFMESAVGKFQSMISAKRAMGELNHPAGPTINLDRVSHLIESLKWQGNNVIGRAKILDTPMGKIAQNLLEGGVQLGVSTRGLGSLKSLPNGINEVQSDFMLNTIDIVGDPSGPACFVAGIMEGVEYFINDNGKIQEQMIKKINKSSSLNQLSEERKLKLFNEFIQSVLNHK
jgi:hypothetical protein